MTSATFRIGGMHCDGCAEQIRGVLAKEPGVHEAAVSFADGEGRVTYNPHATGQRRLVELIEGAGFSVETA